jgi:outer membrane protein OmpA-like peptidoglycan-associated protein
MRIGALALVGVVTAGCCSEPQAASPSPQLARPEVAAPTPHRAISKAPPPKRLVIFFGFAKTNLTTEGRRVLADAVRAGKQEGYDQVTITGNTDTVGSEPYNFELSVRRAQVVRDEMVGQGVNGWWISFEGRGARNLLVQTAPGVREPQNRRVIIDLSS